MGKITYRPNKTNRNAEKVSLKESGKKNITDEIKSTALYEDAQIRWDLEQKEEIKTIAKELNNIKPVGDLDCDYHIYLEDYVYTYLYQYAQVDLSTESSAVFLGKYYPESKEVIVRGIIPVAAEGLSGESEWIDEEVLKQIENEREAYFKNEEIIGWMHMQPGYGTMLTMKELREHKRVFGEADSIFMLVDAINKIETLYVYENGELKEQTGYYMYYERNEQMQKYMLEHPFMKKEAEVTEDTVVNQFREIGKLRKAQYVQRKNVNMTVIVASIVLIGLTAVIVRMNDSEKVKSVSSNQAVSQNNSVFSKDIGNNNDEEAIKFIINEDKTQHQGAIKQSDTPKTLADINAKENESAMPVSVSAEKVPELSEKEGKSQKNDKEDVVVKDSDKEVVQADSEDKINVGNKEKAGKTAEKNKMESEIQYEKYVVKEGDTLANISCSKYGSADRSKEIAKINDLGDTDLIRVGQTLKLPEN